MLKQKEQESEQVSRSGKRTKEVVKNATIILTVAEVFAIVTNRLQITVTDGKC